MDKPNLSFKLGSYVPSLILPKSNYNYSEVVGEKLTYVSSYNSSSFCVEPINLANLGSEVTEVFIPDELTALGLALYEFDENDILLVRTIMIARGSRVLNLVKLQENTKKIGFNIGNLFLKEQAPEEIDFSCITLFFALRKAQPHYKELFKKMSLENDEHFYKTSLEGKVTLFKEDYAFVQSQPLDSSLTFMIFEAQNVIYAGEFIKTDCEFNLSAGSVELKFLDKDRYSKIRAAYDNTYDLIKLAPAITKLGLTQRSVLQLYIAGGNSVTHIAASGAYWEDEVIEAVDDESALINKYYFAKNGSFTEVHLDSFAEGSRLNGTYTQVSDGFVNSLYKGSRFEWHLKYVAGDTMIDHAGGYAKTDELDNDSYYVNEDSVKFAKYNLYELRLLYSPDIEADVPQYITSYKSEHVYTGAYLLKDLSQGEKYKMVNARGLDDSFYLGENIIINDIYARLLTNIETIQPIPWDDFVKDRGNYKYCAAATLAENSFVQSEATSEEPTKFGINDYDKYFTNKDIESGQNIPIPVCRSAWANTALWYINGPVDAFETEFILKDSFYIADVIKVLLHEIDPSVSHEGTEEYSSFLYSNYDIIDNTEKQYIYITQRTNILKGNYDQAAQKAEITLKDLMTMLKNCFRCFWFIDSQNRFRIEHESYFLGKGIYANSFDKVDLSISHKDKFNKKNILFFQKTISWDKQEMPKRYEFKWDSDSTDLFGNLVIDIKDRFASDKTESINAGPFSADIDLMLAAPDKFSEEGFALILTGSSKKTILTKRTLIDEASGKSYEVDIQNYYASWLNLIKYYMYSFSGRHLKYNILPDGSLKIKDLVAAKQHSFACFFELAYIPGYIKTDIGEGYIADFKINIGTGLADVTAKYSIE